MPLTKTASTCYDNPLPPCRRRPTILRRVAKWRILSLTIIRICLKAGVPCVAIVQVKDLIEAGVHFGHRASRWNPKMRPFIYGKRNLIHIIDLRETVRGLLRAYRYLGQVASRGSLVLFVGTKRQAKEAIEREAGRGGMPYVSEGWVGVGLTNSRRIPDRLKRLQELEGLWLAAGERADKTDMTN